MSKRRQAVRVRQDQSFKGRQFNAEVILWAVRWYLNPSYGFVMELVAGFGGRPIWL